MPETFYSIWEVDDSSGMFRSLSTPKEIERNFFLSHPDAVKALRASIVSVRLSGALYTSGRRRFKISQESRWTHAERAVGRMAKFISDVARRQIHQMAMDGKIIA